jgi:hypothetical protein
MLLLVQYEAAGAVQGESHRTVSRNQRPRHRYCGTSRLAHVLRQWRRTLRVRAVRRWTARKRELLPRRGVALALHAVGIGALVLDLALACHRSGRGASRSARRLLRCPVAGLHRGHAVRFPIAVADVAFELLSCHPGFIPPRMPPRMRARRRRATTNSKYESHPAGNYRYSSHEDLHRGESRNAGARPISRCPRRTPPVADVRCMSALTTALRQRDQRFGDPVHAIATRLGYASPACRLWCVITDPVDRTDIHRQPVPVAQP